MGPSSPPQPPPDPALQQEQQQANADLMNAAQGRVQSDTANLMAQYGTRLAMAGTLTGSPLSTGAKV